MDGQTSGTTEAMDSQVQVDPWIAAFAALEPKGEEAPADNAGDNGDQAAADTGAAGGQQGVSDNDEAANGGASEDDAGGLGSDAGGSDESDGDSFFKMFGVEEESLQQFEQELNESIRDQAISEVAQEFIKRGVRNVNGKLGATLDDPDICKRDDDGVPHFYNPETGQEFRGDNPRRQAQEWVDDYNKELARVFNNTCEQYENHLREQEAPKIAVRKFAPTYNKLDDIRRGMLDNVIEDYEIRDNNGDLIGYSCDLDKALAMVERQITMIQNYAKQAQPKQEQQQSSGPALDMKTSSGAISSGEQAPPKSLAEAMEREQDKILERMRK